MQDLSRNPELREYLSALLGEGLDAFIRCGPEMTGLRVNMLKSSASEVEQLMNRHDVPFERIAYGENGYRIRRDHLPLSHTLSFFTGAFQYQGEASQLPVNILDPSADDSVLDMAAAPGSKSTQIAAKMENRGELVVNDISVSRLQPLNTNLQRCGSLNHYVVNQRGENLGVLYPEYFDKVLLDAPCSALGTLAGHPEIINWWRMAKLRKLSQIQYQLLVSAVKALKPGGEMVYSTCSVAPEENEEPVSRILDTYPVEILPPAAGLPASHRPGWTSWNGRAFHPEIRHAVRLWPQHTATEGFFIVRLRKKTTLHRYQTRSVEWRTTLTTGHTEVSEVLRDLETIWGIRDIDWDNYRYIRSSTRLWITAKDVIRLPADSMISAGLLLAEKRIRGWKLTNASVQLLGEVVNQRHLDLSHEDLVALFRDHRLAVTGIPDGYYVLRVDAKPVASVFVSQDQMKIRLPHSFRLVLGYR